MSSLQECRQRIDALDADIVRLLNDRIRTAMEIGRLKQEMDAPVYVPAREMQVFEKVMKLNQGPMSDVHVRAIYREIMSAAISQELETSIAFLGPNTTHTHQAALSKFGQSLRYLPCETIEQVFEEVEKNNAQYGVVPIENSIEGGVAATQDRLTRTPLKVTAEIYLPVHHGRLVRPGETSPERIYSKPETLAENIQDLEGNSTRFLVLGHQYGPPSGKDKTSIFFGVRHKTDALFTSLEPLQCAGLNLIKIESRPSKQREWEYTFFVDIEGHADDPPVKAALDELADHCLEFTILGSYPIAFRS